MDYMEKEKKFGIIDERISRLDVLINGYTLSLEQGWEYSKKPVDDRQSFLDQYVQEKQLLMELRQTIENQ